MHDNLLFRLYKFAVATHTGCVRLKLHHNLYLIEKVVLQPARVAVDWNYDILISVAEKHQLQPTRVALDWNANTKLKKL